MAVSLVRSDACASSRLATFATAMSSTNPTAPWSTSRENRAPSVSLSCSDDDVDASQKRRRTRIISLELRVKCLHLQSCARHGNRRCESRNHPYPRGAGRFGELISLPGRC